MSLLSSRCLHTDSTLDLNPVQFYDDILNDEIRAIINKNTIFKIYQDNQDTKLTNKIIKLSFIQERNPDSLCGLVCR